MNVTSLKTAPTAYWAAALTLLLWSSSYAAIGYGLEVFTPGELALLRFSVASLCFVVPVAAGWIKLPPRRDWPAVIVLGLIGNTAYQLCLGYSMTRISAGAASVVISMVPAVTAVLAVLRLKEKLSGRAVLGLGVAFAGTVLVTLGRGHAIQFDPIVLLVFVAVLCSSTFFVWQKPLLARTSPLGFTAAAIFVGTLGMIPFGLQLPEKLLQVPVTEIVSAVYLGLLPTVVGFVSWSWALSRAPASRVSGFLYLQPVLACVIAWFWLREVPTWITVAGGVLAVGGVILTTFRGARARQQAGVQVRKEKPSIAAVHSRTEA